MNQVLNYTARQERRMASFTGTDTLKEGYPLCYNRDSNTGVTVTSQETDKIYRDTQVEKPASGNLDNFAGVVAPEFDGRTGPCEVELIEAGVCRVWTGAATTINSTDIGIGATYVCIAATNAVPAIAKALVTDASTTAKARLAVLVCPVAVEKTVDNRADCLESIRRLRESLGAVGKGAGDA